MPSFRKKPVVIEAWQWNGEMPDTVNCPKWLLDDENLMFGVDGDCNFVGLVISTLEGDLHVSVNDWIIRGVKGELYPCKPDIFAATYEPVNDDT